RRLPPAARPRARHVVVQGTLRRERGRGPLGAVAVTKPRPTLKTYSHLAAARRVPTEYEIVTTRLHHHVERGFEIDGPVPEWYARHLPGSRWRADDWERFADPRETTYTKYTRIQQAKEAYVDGLLASIDESSHDREMAPEARALLARTLPPLRFVFHGL